MQDVLFTERRAYMQCVTDNLGAMSTGITYCASVVVILGDTLAIIDKHAASIGVLMGACTMLTNIFFKYLHRRDLNRQLANIDPSRMRAEERAMIELENDEDY